MSIKNKYGSKIKLKRTFAVFFSFLVAAIPHSCKKEYSCENCKDGNRGPIANAGTDQTISLPKDSVVLDGSASSDPGGSITSYKWIKITGPASSDIVKPDSAKTAVKALIAGVYQFELTVKDNGGLTAKDTVQVVVDAPSNQPPVACAGADQTITLPANSVTLDGSCSADSDNNITSYLWTKISGPPTFAIATATKVQTQLTNLTEGTYQFELKITDAGGFTSKDTVQVMVLPAVSTVACNDVNRPTFHAQLVPIGKLSKTREGITAAAAGTKVVFAGGKTMDQTDCPECWGSAQVDIYDTVTKTWTTAKLSTGRFDVSTIAAGNKLFFAGGVAGDGANNTYYTNIDIYDVVTNSWSVKHLSEARHGIGAALLGDKVFFAGGEKNWRYEHSDRVDIYSLSTDSWSTAILSNQRTALSAVSADDKVYFAGGWEDDSRNALSNRIDIYDSRTNAWSTSTLKVHKGKVGGAVLQNYIYWSNDCQTEIRSARDGTSKLASKSHPYGFPVVKNNKVIFIAKDKFDVYNPANDQWSVGLLLKSIDIRGNVVSLNNTIYLTDGNQVYKLEF